MDAIQTLLNSMFSSLGPWIPRVLGALVILVVIWIIATVLKEAILRLGRKANLDSRLKSVGVTGTFANLAYWLAWLIGLPVLLDSLGLGDRLAPVTNLTNGIMGFLPNLIGAAVILGIGYLVAKVVREIVTNLLTAAGSEKLATRLGMNASLGKGGLAGLVGMILFVLIMLPVVAAALQPLGLESVTRPITNMLDTVVSLIPKLAGAAIILIIAVVFGRIVANIVGSVLSGLGFNNVVSKLGLGQNPRIAGRTPSELAGTLVFAGILTAALTQASEIVGFTTLRTAIGDFGAIAATVFTGLIVLGIGLWLSNLAAHAITDSNIANRNVLAKVARIAILFFTVPMALRQMGLPSEIVTVGFGTIMGALTIAAAIAFGIGGRHAAGRIADSVANSFDENRALSERAGQ